MNQITIVLELYMRIEELEKYLTCRLLRAARAEFFWKKWFLYLLICCIHSNFQFKIQRTRNQGLPIEISRKVP